MNTVHPIQQDILSLRAIQNILKEQKQLALSTNSAQKVEQCYTYLHDKIQQSDQLFYGINTGFGSLCNVQIDKQQLEELQANLVMSHAVGTGDKVPIEVVRLMLLLKIKNLSFGYSGIHPNTLQRLIDSYNSNMLPVIFQLGSLGASGDLAPLAHLALPLLGMGQVYDKGKIIDTEQALAQRNWSSIKLRAKEGLALLNGTQFSLAYGTWAWLEGQRLLELADMTAAMSIDGFQCSLSPYDNRLHQIRPHQGQIETAKNILDWLEGSELAQQPTSSVQDPYAFRCVPQVHGASKDTWRYAQQVLETEINSVTDNPNIFPDSDAILSGGNFHAQPLALILDYMAIAIAEIASISERRIYQLISGQRGLPPFLTPYSGLHSGMMISQYTAASIVSQNKQLCTPASVDSIVSCNGQEDHVSMAANAGTKLYKVIENVRRVLAIEFMLASQALSLRTHPSSPQLMNRVKAYRKVVPQLKEDRFLAKDLELTIQFLSSL